MLPTHRLSAGREPRAQRRVRAVHGPVLHTCSGQESTVADCVHRETERDRERQRETERERQVASWGTYERSSDLRSAARHRQRRRGPSAAAAAAPAAAPAAAETPSPAVDDRAETGRNRHRERDPTRSSGQERPRARAEQQSLAVPAPHTAGRRGRPHPPRGQHRPAGRAVSRNTPILLCELTSRSPTSTCTGRGADSSRESGQILATVVGYTNIQ
eukprot:COSAG03_NODE_1898_length_3378_cov_28.274169_2_plen_216_part_00